MPDYSEYRRKLLLERERSFAKRLKSFEESQEYKSCCEACRSLVENMFCQGSPFEHQRSDATKYHGSIFQLGNQEEIHMRSRCILCRLAAKLIPPAYSGPPGFWVPRYFFKVYHATFEGVQLYVRDDQDTCYGYIYAPEDAPFGSPKLVKPSEGYRSLNPGILRNWIAECTNGHKNPMVSNSGWGFYHPESQTPMIALSDESINITLIDVCENRLVGATSRERYLALSYVWGGVSGLKLTTSNREKLEEPGSLESEASLIPQVIRDAILLTRSIGENFLWVDTLCIEQDNHLQKHFNISMMDIVYSQALATLAVVSAVHADCAILGLRAATRVPHHSESTINLRNMCGEADAQYTLVTRAPPVDSSLIETVYEKRAWTFQEKLLSQRCIYLANHNSFFHCIHGHWYTEQYANTRDIDETGSISIRKVEQQLMDPLRHPAVPLEARKYERILASYTVLVDQLSTRHLSYETDTLSAFSGVLKMLLRSVGGVAVGGLIGCMLTQCLLWVHDPSNDSPSRKLDFPSFSWAGWTGPISYQTGPLYPKKVFEIAHELDKSKKAYHSTFSVVPMLISELKNVGTRHETPMRHIHVIEDPQIDDASVGEPEIIGLGIDVLHFDAEVVRMSEFEIHQLESRRYTRSSERIKLEGLHLGSSTHTCGMFWPTSKLADYQEEKRDIDFIKIARFPCPALDTHHSGQVIGLGFSTDPDLSPDEFGTRIFCGWVYKGLEFVWNKSYCTDSDCSLFHIMAIEWHGDRAERVGLGTIQAGAWNQAKRTMKHIVLV